MKAPRDFSELRSWIGEITAAQSVDRGVRIQALWGGYGEIRRYGLVGAQLPSLVVKHVMPPPSSGVAAPARRGRERKLRSYEVELAFYEDYAERCGSSCRLPRAFGIARSGAACALGLEDLEARGFSSRSRVFSEQDIVACLDWLASFHATFLGTAPRRLWSVGTYWHLGTRPDELAALDDEALRRAAPVIDARLRSARFSTLIHGDAKSANFCLSSGKEVTAAAVDFQYVGGGAGIKDVAYFLSSCLSPRTLTTQAERYLDVYFHRLQLRLEQHRPELDTQARVALEAEWRALYPWAWADFHRFLLGWAPAEAAAETYGHRLTQAVLRSLRAG